MNKAQQIKHLFGYYKIKCLDIVKIKSGKLAIVIEVNSQTYTDHKRHYSCSLMPFDLKTWHEKYAWYCEDELEVVGNVVDLYANKI